MTSTTDTSASLVAVPVAIPSSSETPVLRSRWVSGAELASLDKAWQHLSEQAIWRNPSLEPNYLIPALTHLASDRVRVLVVEDQSAIPEQQLLGLVPIELKRLFRLPFQAAEAWKHEQCFDATPLLDRRHAPAAWSQICKHLLADGITLLSLDTVAAEQEVETVFQYSQDSLGLTRFQRDRYQRAAFQPAPTADQYVSEFVSKSVRKNVRRLTRRLEDAGQIRWETSSHDSDFDQLTEDFLRIESSGWKGQEGTALASNPTTKAFYRDLIRRTAAAGKARFLSLKLDGKPIAMLSDIQSGKVVFSYKTAYDDAFANYSPGQQIEVKNLEFLHRDGIELADSCTVSDNSTINRIWGQRISFQNVIFSLKPGIARTAVKSLPALQAAVHRLRAASGKNA